MLVLALGQEVRLLHWRFCFARFQVHPDEHRQAVGDETRSADRVRQQDRGGVDRRLQRRRQGVVAERRRRRQNLPHAAGGTLRRRVRRLLEGSEVSAAR